MDNKTQNILQKFSTQKVELSSTQLLNDIAKESKKLIARAMDFEQELKEFSKSALRLNSDAGQISKAGQKVLQEFESKAKELGVNPNQVKEFKEAFNAWSGLDTIVKRTEAASKLK